MLNNFDINFATCPPMYGSRVDSFRKFVTEIISKTYPVVVEIGCLRREVDDPNISQDGGSTPIIAWGVNQAHGTFDCCDINELAVTRSLKAIGHYGLLNENIHVHHMDGMDFISGFDHKIDAIYIDGFDFSTGLQEKSMDWHLDIFKAAEPLLASRAVIMFDDIFNVDTWFGKGGKAIPYMLESGNYEILHKAYQVILRKLN